MTHNFYSSKISKCHLSEQPKTYISPPLRTNFASLCLEIVDRRVDLIEVKQGYSLHADENPYETTTDYKDMIKSTGNGTATVDTSGLFDDLELLNNPLEDTDILDQEGPDETKFPLGFLDELNTTLPVTTDPLESILDLEKSTSSMDNPFFEEFMDLDQLFPELSSVDFGFEVEQASPVLTSDICQSDVVTIDTGECPEAASPCSDIIDVVTFESSAEVPICPLDESIIDIALSSEYTVDVVTVDEGSVSMETVTDLIDCHQIEASSQPVSDKAEITVVEASDPLTLLTQELTETSSLKEISELPPSTLTVDLDQLLAFSSTVELADVASPCTDDGTESTTGSPEVSVNPATRANKKRASSEERSHPPPKKPKCTDGDGSELDRKTIRRLKNNVASKYARAARKQKEQDLFKQEEELEKSNAELRKQLQELELLTTALRKVLVEKLSGATFPL